VNAATSSIDPSPGGTRPIVALDVSSLDAARQIVEQLGDRCDFYKIGLQLFSAVGPRAVEELRRAGKDVFVDLKLHDIPNTVRGAARSVAGLGARLLTVHALGGESMVAAAVEGAGGHDGPCRILAVTVLTSLERGALSAALGHEIPQVQDEVMRLARVARRSGAHGIVCSGHEVAAVVAEHGQSLRALVPGVRLRGTGADDQARVVTPEEAAAAGASYVVIGRTVTAAADPAAAMDRVREALGLPALA
jgi:orotidine-5'-phosphate decarboxylase